MLPTQPALLIAALTFAGVSAPCDAGRQACTTCRTAGACTLMPWRLNHLDRQIALCGRIGEAAHTMVAHAPCERQLVRESGALLLGRLLRFAAAVREQATADARGRLELGVADPELLHGRLGDPCADGRRVGELRHSVGAHAAGEARLLRSASSLRRSWRRRRSQRSESRCRHSRPRAARTRQPRRPRRG